MICGNCIHDGVCGLEGHLDEALTFCADKVTNVQPVDRWISVDKALPDNGQTVLIYFDNQFYIAKYNSDFADTMPWSSSGHWWGKELIHFWCHYQYRQKIKEQDAIKGGF